jgi:hypothetical protein
MWGGRPRLSIWAVGPRIVMTTFVGQAPSPPFPVFNNLQWAFDRARGLQAPLMFP